METISARNYSGQLNVPPSKSDAQRALLAAAFANGKSTVTGLGKSQDELVMLKFIQDIGAQYSLISEHVIQVDGIKKFPSEGKFFVGESGLSTRLITAMCSAHEGTFKIDGEGSILKRPMKFFENYLPHFGGRIETTNGFLPITTVGPLKGRTATLDCSSGSQFLSGLLMALPLVDGDSKLKVLNLVSTPYVEMTLNTLKKFGIIINHSELSSFSIAGNQTYIATNYNIESDWSSASYWLVASALGMNISCKGLNLNSLQADRAILSAFEKANCSFLENSNRLQINGDSRKAFTFDATDCPDLFPALATFASLTSGTTRIFGLKRLKEKESDRGVALQTEFGKLGITIELNSNEMIIHGKDKIEGGTVNSHDDHRIAMCLGIAGMFAESPISIQGSESVSKSYPNFWKDLNTLMTHQ